MGYIGVAPAATGSVGTNQLADTAVTTAKIADNNVTGAKFNADVISSQTELAETPASTDELLLSDAGTLKRVDFSYLSTSLVASSKASTSSSGTFTISSLTIGIPLFLIGGNTAGSATDKTEIKFKVTSGTANDGQCNGSSIFFGLFSDDTISAMRPPGTVVIPSATSVVLNVTSIVGTLKAYQAG
jgi:hypothetical protein